MEPPDEKPHVTNIHIHGSTIGAIAGGTGSRASSGAGEVGKQVESAPRALRWIPWVASIVGFVLVLAAIAVVFVYRQPAAAEISPIPADRRQLERLERSPIKMAAEDPGGQPNNAPRAPDESALAPDERTSRILQALPDVCAAKRLLAKASDPKSNALRKARAAIAAAEAKQLAAEKDAFAARRTYICSDGWISACLCSHAASGCCSTHHGVAGCEPFPKEVSCPGVD